MLRKIPDSAVAFASDGVLPASAQRQAACAEKLERFARARAGQWMASAQHEADVLRARAVQAGYEEGFVLALTQFVPLLAEVLISEAVLRTQVQHEMEKFIRTLLCDAGLEAALIERSCQMTAAQEPPGEPWTLYVPEGRAALVERLTAALAPEVLRVRPGQAPYPVLERGELVLELDAQRPALAQLTNAIDEHLAIKEAQRRAADYAAGVQKALRIDHVGAGLRATNTTEALT